MRKLSKRLVLAMIALAWSTLFLPFSAPLADAKPLKQVSQLTVFDANNKKVGEANFQGDDDVQVVFEVDKSIFFVQVTREGFTSGETLYYESTDCSGTALDDVDDDLVREGIIGPDGGTVYLPDPNATPSNYHILSEFTEDDDDDTDVRSCRSVDYWAVQIATIPIINLLDIFTPPFSVR